MKDPQFRHLVSWANARFVGLWQICTVRVGSSVTRPSQPTIVPWKHRADLGRPLSLGEDEKENSIHQSIIANTVSLGCDMGIGHFTVEFLDAVLTTNHAWPFGKRHNQKQAIGVASVLRGPMQ